MKKNTIYKITVLNWEKHNPNRKKSYKYTLIANNFCSDSKMEVLPMSVRWMYLGLLLLCGDHAEGTVKVGGSTLKGLLKTGVSIAEGLTLLESLQLVTSEILEFPLILNELNRIERKGIELVGLKATSELLEAVSESAEVQPHQLPEIIKPQKKKIHKADPVRIKTCNEFTQVVGTDIMEAWCKIYNDEDFLNREVDKSFAWMLTNPQKSTRTPRGWRQFYNNWFRNAWDDRMKKTQSVKQKHVEVFRP